MGLTMKERKAVTGEVCRRYRKATKKDKGRILDEFVRTTGFNRGYARWLLRQHGRRVPVRPGVQVEGDGHLRPERIRPRTYGPEVQEPLTKIWTLLDYPASKRLAAALPEVVPHLLARKALRLPKTVREKLLAISAATIDRLLKPERQKHQLKGRSHTKPGTLLKHQVPIRTFADWDDARPGFLEIDLAGHDGGRAEGDYCDTLNITDVDSGWTELAALKNKAEIWVFEALTALRPRLPFPLLGIDSDNGSEFINRHLVRYCEQERISFTRSRPYKKNDTCYVEQKNWSVVRQTERRLLCATQQCRGLECRRAVAHLHPTD